MSDWYQIENGTMTVQVTSTGAEMKVIFAKPWLRDLLWYPRDEAAKKIWNRSAPVLFPVVGKCQNDTYKLIDKSYTMPQHGFARDKTFTCLKSDSTELEFFLEADQETFKLYPFCFELRVKYLLEAEKLTITYSVKNVDRQEIYFSIGAHPAFEILNLKNCEIHFEHIEAGFYRLENGLVNWKQKTELDSNIIKPSKELFAHDALIFKDMKSKFVDLVDTKKKHVVRIGGTDTPYLGLWAKESVPFICVEPWYGVSDEEGHDQFLNHKKGIQTLGIGKTFNFSYSIELAMAESS
jgi:galactose mutarotase-like enzyme